MLILVSHGSRNPQWRASVDELVDSLQADLGSDRICLAHMDCAPPTLADVAADAVFAGVKKIRVLPLFLTGEGHVDRNIRPAVDELRKMHQSVEIELLPPVGRHPLFRKMLRDIAAAQTS